MNPVIVKTISNLAEHNEAGHLLYEHSDELYSSLSNAYAHMTEHMDQSSHIDGVILLHTLEQDIKWVEVTFTTEEGIAYSINNFHLRLKHAENKSADLPA